MKKDKIFKVSNKGNGKAEILIYAEIGGFFGLSSFEFIQEINNLGKVNHVDLRVSSEGGSVIEAIDMYNAIRRHPATWHAHIDGLAASSASWLVLATDKIYMAENAQYMIHRASTGAWGTADELRKMADLTESIEQTAMVNAYTAKTGMDDKTIMDMLNAETWLTADKAKEFGFVDEISETLQMAASVKLSGRYAYAHAPETLLTNNDGEPGDDDSDDNSSNVTPLLQAARLAAAKLKY
jgi:ATP-dependent protease ClpP protease subunit